MWHRSSEQPRRDTPRSISEKSQQDGRHWSGCWGDTLCPRAKEEPQQDGRRGKFTFRIKPHSHQRCSEGSNKPWTRTQGPHRDWDQGTQHLFNFPHSSLLSIPISAHPNFCKVRQKEKSEETSLTCPYSLNKCPNRFCSLSSVDSGNIDKPLPILK